MKFSRSLRGPSWVAVSGVFVLALVVMAPGALGQTFTTWSGAVSVPTVSGSGGGGTAHGGPTWSLATGTVSYWHSADTISNGVWSYNESFGFETFPWASTSTRSWVVTVPYTVKGDVKLTPTSPCRSGFLNASMGVGLWVHDITLGVFTPYFGGWTFVKSIATCGGSTWSGALPTSTLGVFHVGLTVAHQYQFYGQIITNSSATEIWGLIGSSPTSCIDLTQAAGSCSGSIASGAGATIGYITVT